MEPVGHLAQAPHGIRLRLPHAEPRCPGASQAGIHHPPCDLSAQQLDALILRLLSLSLQESLHARLAARDLGELLQQNGPLLSLRLQPLVELGSERSKLQLESHLGALEGVLALLHRTNLLLP